LIAKACLRLTKLESEGCEAYVAWNRTSVDLVKAAKVRINFSCDLLSVLFLAIGFADDIGFCERQPGVLPMASEIFFNGQVVEKILLFIF